jgi:hypothetical protein
MIGLIAILKGKKFRCPLCGGYYRIKGNKGRIEEHFGPATFEPKRQGE